MRPSTAFRSATSAVASLRMLFHRAIAACHEGGVRLLARRFRRWWDHQWASYRPSKAYQRWISENTPSQAELREQRAWSRALQNPTRITLVCPLYHTPIEILKQTIQSVQQQTYPHWQLCLAVSEQESPDLWRTVDQLVAADPRIQVVPLKENQGIAASTNAAITAANADWVGFLDHDDLLAPHALYSVANYLGDHPECDLVYTDEDLLSANGGFRKSPMLKPGWSPEMLLSFNYICHFVVMQKALLQKVGGLRAAYDGAQDWDLLLRVAEQTEEIHHLPQILYHWRESRGSTAGQSGAKPYIAKAQEAVHCDCLTRRQIAAKPAQNRLGHFRLDWDSILDVRVSIIIPNRNQPHLIRKVVEGVLYETAYQNTEIIIVDNQSTDPEVLRLYKKWQADKRVQVLAFEECFNYSKACNRGAAVATGEFLLFLNNDVHVIDPNWLSELLGWARQPGVGVVGGHLIYPDGRTQHAGIALGLYELAGHMFSAAPPETTSPFGMAEWLRNVSAVTGACQLIRHSLFESLAGYDEGFRIVYSDLDLCLRASLLGHRIVYTPYSRLIHHECSTREPGNNLADARRFAHRLLSYGVQTDRYYHQALSAFARCPQFKSQLSPNVAGNLLEQVQQLSQSSEEELPGIESPCAQLSWE